MRLYIVRHADPDYRTDHQWEKGGSLTAHGKKEAEALRRAVQAAGVDRAFSSQLGRARLTARLALDGTGVEAEVQEWMAELPWRLDSGSLVWHLDPATVLHQSRGSVQRAQREEGGEQGGTTLWEDVPPYAQFEEHYKQVCENSDRFLAGLGLHRASPTSFAFAPDMLASAKARQQNVWVFCHGGFGLAWLSHLLSLPLSVAFSSFWLAPSSVTTVLLEEREGGRVVTPRCLEVGSTAHLLCAGLKTQNSKYEQDSPSGLKHNFW